MTEIFRFSKEHCDWTETDLSKSKKVLGGKGASLVMMAQAGMPVPPGFTITTDVCNAYRKEKAKNAGNAWPEWFLDEVMKDVEKHMAWLTSLFGFTPLVSVRSGAPISMPGMMDTILNVGLCDANFKDWLERIGLRAVHDTDRRLLQMLGATGYGIPAEVFAFQLAKIKKKYGVTSDTELSHVALSETSFAYSEVFQKNVGFKFPHDNPTEQLRVAIRAVFDSWSNERAIEYRKINKISDDMGTAVTVQAMVFGNMGEDSGSGVLFTCDPSTGEDNVMGEYLVNAQGEDVVSGVRTPQKLSGVPLEGNGWLKELTWVCTELEEKMYRDMVDVEFTVQKGQLFILQSRVGKRSARAAIKIAVDMANKGIVDRKTALSRVTVEQFKIAGRPSIDPKFSTKPHMVGLPACPGVASGVPVFSSKDAVNCTVPCVLVTHETTPEDIAGMYKAMGILTMTGGATSHAAVVARSMDKACIVGCTDLDWDALKKASKVTIDGATGRVWVDTDVPVIDSSDAPEIEILTSWCLDELGCIHQEITERDDGVPHRILMSHWWGDKEVLEAVLDGLEALPSRTNITLDCCAPADMRPTPDDLLYCAFGNVDSKAGFRTVIADTLKSRAAKLGGLNLLNLDADQALKAEMRKLGYGLCGNAETLADVLDGGYVRITDDFVSKVLGGNDALTKLKSLLNTAGLDLKAVPESVPADYAAFVVLSR